MVILLEDSPAVQQAKNALMIGYAAGDSAESVTQDVMLPTAGANGVSISWESSDAARVSTTGAVSRPNDQIHRSPSPQPSPKTKPVTREPSPSP